MAKTKAFNEARRKWPDSYLKMVDLSDGPGIRRGFVKLVEEVKP